MSMLSLAVNIGFYAARGVSSLDLLCRDMSLRSACSSTLIDPAASLIGLDVLIASWLSHCEDTNTMFGTASLIHMRSGVLLVSVRDYFPSNKTNKQCTVLLCGGPGEWAQAS